MKCDWATDNGIKNFLCAWGIDLGTTVNIESKKALS